VEIERELDFIDMYEQLSELRFVEENIVCLQPILAGKARIFARLKQWNNTLAQIGEVDAEAAHVFETSIESLEAMIEALQANASFLLSRISSAVQMVIFDDRSILLRLTTNYKASDTISLKSQNTTETMSNHMLRDSTAVRVITVVTLVYLPATFTAVSFMTLAVTSSEFN
jgi:hypothetical protein